MEINEKRKRKRKTTQKNSSTGKVSRQIPKQCFENALKVINDPSDLIWKNHGNACERYIHQNLEFNSQPRDQPFLLDSNTQLQYARNCLVRRDFKNLAKVLLLYKPQKGNEKLISVYAKYANICLAYTNQPLLESLLQSFGCKQDTKSALEDWTSLPKEGDESFKPS